MNWTMLSASAITVFSIHRLPLTHLGYIAAIAITGLIALVILQVIEINCELIKTQMAYEHEFESGDSPDAPASKLQSAESNSKDDSKQG